MKKERRRRDAGPVVVARAETVLGHLDFSRQRSVLESSSRGPFCSNYGYLSLSLCLYHLFLRTLAGALLVSCLESEVNCFGDASNSSSAPRTFDEALAFPNFFFSSRNSPCATTLSTSAKSAKTKKMNPRAMVFGWRERD